MHGCHGCRRLALLLVALCALPPDRIWKPVPLFAMDIQFGIHQELWQDAWIAATSAVRARKRQIDLNVQQRVQRLMAEHSPSTGKALTLRVYGTMIKGFCVINNDRARVLHSDCERVVLLFAEQPYSDNLKLMKGPAKRQRVDAVTLDLSRVKEAEVFDWTQTPLGEDLLHLGPVERLPEPQEVTGWAMGMMAMPSLVEEAPEAFPETPGAAPALELVPAPNLADLADLGDLGDLGPVDGADLAVKESKPKRRRRWPPPGHVLGFDESSMAEVAEAKATMEPPGLASLAERVREGREIDHLGPLRMLLDPRPAADPLRLPAADGLSAPPSESLPDLQPLLSDQVRPEMLGAVFAQSPEGEAFLTAAAQAAEAKEGAAAEALMQALADDPMLEAESKSMDAQTAQIGAVIRHFVEEHRDGPVMLDDLMPPSCTEKTTAARTFGCLLGLATSGGLQVYQELPYGPIAIALA